MREAGLAAVKVDDRTSESALPGGIRVMTMHCAKGLDYRAVAVRDASLRSGGARRHMVDEDAVSGAAPKGAPEAIIPDGSLWLLA